MPVFSVGPCMYRMSVASSGGDSAAGEAAEGEILRYRRSTAQLGIKRLPLRAVLTGSVSLTVVSNPPQISL